MTRWTRRLRAAIGMGATWAVTWVAAGLAIGVSSVVIPVLPWRRFFETFDAPLPALALPGFIGGALFSLVVGVAGRKLRFEQLSLPRFTAWGALGGVLLAFLPQTMAALGLATLSSRFSSPWELTAIIVGPITLLSAASACVTLLLARRGSRHGVIEPSLDGANLTSEHAGFHPLPTGHGLDAIGRALREASPEAIAANARQPHRTTRT